jgi:HAD superfamily hydrolase (TIGR01459 family)
MDIPIIPGLGPLAARYDGFLLDLWGVVHNGHEPYRHAVDCMRRLRGGGGRVLLLSNAPRRAEAVQRLLDRIGVPCDAYDDILTSGELTRRALADARDGMAGTNYLRLGPERDWELLEGLDFTPVPDLAQADFVLCTGLYDDETETVDDYAGLLAAAAERRLPMLCANPDLTVMRGSKSVLCAGAIAAAYEACGGKVRYHGKPHAGAYAACFDLLQIPASRLLAVGDSLRTDIAGAQGAGIASVLVAGGIHAEEWGLKPGEVPDGAKLAAACDRAGVRPAAVIAGLRW